MPAGRYFGWQAGQVVAGGDQLVAGRMNGKEFSVGFRRRVRRRALIAGAAGGAALAHHASKKAGEQQQYDDQAPADDDQGQGQEQEQEQAQYAPPPADPADEIEHLAQLHASGALSDEEFTAAKAKILGS